MNTLAGVKAGEDVFTIKDGWTKVSIHHQVGDLTIFIKGLRYQTDGRLNKTDRNPSAWLYNPLNSSEPKRKDDV